jgi:hypothetical protein
VVWLDFLPSSSTEVKERVHIYIYTLSWSSWPVIQLILLDVLLTMYHTYQYSETNVMNILFSLLRIKGLYVFRALLAHPQEALHKQHLVYCVRVMSVACTRIGVEHARNIQCTACVAPPEEEQVMLETCRNP